MIYGWGNTDKEKQLMMEEHLQRQKQEHEKSMQEARLGSINTEPGGLMHMMKKGAVGAAEREKLNLGLMGERGKELGAVTSYGGQGELTPAEIAASRQAGGLGQPVEMIRGMRGSFAGRPGAGGEYLTMGQARQAIRRDISGLPTGEVSPEMAQEGVRGRFEYPYVSAEAQKALDTGTLAEKEAHAKYFTAQAGEKEAGLIKEAQDSFRKSIYAGLTHLADKDGKLPPFVDEVIANKIGGIKSREDSGVAHKEALKLITEMAQISQNKEKLIKEGGLPEEWKNLPINMTTYPAWKEVQEKLYGKSISAGYKTEGEFLTPGSERPAQMTYGQLKMQQAEQETDPALRMYKKALIGPVRGFERLADYGMEGAKLINRGIRQVVPYAGTYIDEEGRVVRLPWK